MRRASSLSGAFGFLAFAGLALSAPDASAQSSVNLTITPNQFYRYASDGTTKISRTYPTPNEQAITKQDCTEDTYVELSLTATGSCADCNIQTWIGPEGVDCTNVDNRSTLQKCWRGSPDVQFPSTGSLAQKMRVQDLLSQYPAYLSSSRLDPNFVKGDATTCTSDKYPATISKLGIYFLILNVTTITAQATTNLPLKMKGPNAPTIKDIKIGDGVITVDFAIDGQSSVLGYKAYCSPVPGKEDPATVVPPPAIPVCEANPFGEVSSGDTSTASRIPLVVRQAATDAGDDADASDAATDDASTDSGSTTSDGGTETQTGATPEVINPSYECASTQNNIATSLKITGTQIGYAYAISVAAFDTFKTVGKPSDWQCAVPVDVTDFWDDYTKAGGPGGGGYCALEGVGVPTSAGGLVLVGVAGAVSALRRRRRS
jgi:hypothetical protein